MAAPKKTPSSPPQKSATTPTATAPKNAPTPVTKPVAVAAAPAVTSAAKSGNGSPATPKKSRVPTHEEIQKRAFEIYASRGYAPGDPNADWAEAERQLKNEM